MQLSLDGQATELRPTPTFGPHFPHHGKPQGYRLGCRCEQCREAKKREKQFRRPRERQCQLCGTHFHYEHGLTGHQTCQACHAPRQALRRQENERRLQPRTCKSCGAEFVRLPGSSHGVKYCAECLVMDKWMANRRKLGKVCPCCLSRHQHGNKYEVCDDCYNSMPRFIWETLYKHHAPLEMALQVASNPVCAICEADLTVREPDFKKRLRPIHAVDHDHKCCERGTSCGKCIRGILCRKCNVALGYLQDDADLAQRAAQYLANWQLTYTKEVN